MQRIFCKELHIKPYLHPLRVLCVLCGLLVNVTAEDAEIAKDSVRAFSTKLLPITLCVLSVLSGFILINRRDRGARKGFGKDFQHKTITHYTSASFAPLAVLF